MFERFYGVLSNDQGMVADSEGYVMTASDEPQPEAPAPPAGASADLFGWYKADAQSFSDGDLARPIIDSSGSGNDLATYGNSDPDFVEPHFDTFVLNAKPVFRFGFTDTIYKTIVPAIAADGYTLAIVVKSALTAPYNALAIVSQTGSFYAALQAAALVGSNVTFTGFGLTSSCQIVVPLYTWQIITLTLDAAEGIPRLRTNDDFAAGPAAPGVLAVNYTQLQATTGWQIAETLHYLAKLSDSDLATLRLYLSQKYDIPITA